MSLSCVFVTLLCVFVSVGCIDSDEENTLPPLSEPLGIPPRGYLQTENGRIRTVDLSDEETRDDWLVEVDQRRLVALENRMRNRDGASTSQTPVLSLEASERLNSSRSSSPSLLAGLDSTPIPPLPGYYSPPPPRARCAVCQMDFILQAQVEAQVESLSSAEPCPWMEQPAAQLLEEAAVRLGEALWVARHAKDTGVGRRLAPAVWNRLRRAISAVLDYSGDRIEAARYWTTPPPPPGTTPTHGPSNSTEPVLAACPICFEQATQMLRPCGHAKLSYAPSTKQGLVIH